MPPRGPRSRTRRDRSLRRRGVRLAQVFWTASALRVTRSTRLPRCGQSGGVSGKRAARSLWRRSGMLHFSPQAAHRRYTTVRPSASVFPAMALHFGQFRKRSNSVELSGPFFTAALPCHKPGASCHHRRRGGVSGTRGRSASVRTRPDDPDGISTPVSVASVGARSLSAAWAVYSPGFTRRPMSIRGIWAS